MLAIAWGGTIFAALLDEFGLVPHLPFLVAIGMTGMLVAAIFVLTRDDVEARERALREEDRDGEQDLLTQLPTFNHFGRRLSDEFNRSRRMGRAVSVVLVDVNNLTAVNREYGVRAGDAVLRHVARTIEATKRYNDVVARLGDDEFGVLLMETGEEGIQAFVGGHRGERPGCLAVGGRLLGERDGDAGDHARRGAARGRDGRPQPGEAGPRAAAPNVAVGVAIAAIGLGSRCRCAALRERW
jgi:GGDEF domain-containing protein